MIQLAASILALGVGPLCDRLTRRNELSRALIDAFVFVAMLGLILGHIIPDACALVGWQALLFAALAWLGPTFFERTVKGFADRAHGTALFLGACGLIVHGTFDGMALVGREGSSGWTALALAVILHRLPAGLTLWWLVRPRYGVLRAQLVLAGLAATTVIGYFGAESLRGRVTEAQEGVFQAIVGGALLHVVTHRHEPAVGTAGAAMRRARFIGTALGSALLAWILGADGHDHSGGNSDDHAAGGGAADAGFLDTFLELTIASAPALVIAFTLAGLIQVYLPKSSLGWMTRGRTLAQSIKGVAFGLPLPICSCGVVPVYRGLVSRGAPTAAALAFLIATPELGIEAVLLSWPLLGGELALVRIAAAAVVAILVAWFAARFAARGHRPPIESAEEDAGGSGLGRAMRVGWVEFFDGTAPWILIGLVIAAACAPLLDEEALTAIPRSVQVPLFALLGMPIYVCASGATPLVAILLAKGASPGAALAFLLTGPATNVTTFGLLRDLHGRRLAFAFVGAVIVTTVTCGFVTDAFLADAGAHAFAPGGEGHAGHGASADHEDHANAFEVGPIAAIVLGLALVASIFRQGPQGFLAAILDRDAAHDDHDHDHGAGTESHEKGGCCH